MKTNKLKLKKFCLIVGLNDKDTKTQKISTLEAYKIAMNIILKYTNGATIYEASGYYKHDDGQIVIEKTLRIELLFIDKEQVLKIIDTLKMVFNQESIILQEETILSELI